MGLVKVGKNSTGFGLQKRVSFLNEWICIFNQSALNLLFPALQDNSYCSGHEKMNKWKPVFARQKKKKIIIIIIMRYYEITSWGST